jgi:hypothetical protein
MVFCASGSYLPPMLWRSAMTLGNMGELRVQRLVASCLNDACRHTALIGQASEPGISAVILNQPVCLICRLSQLIYCDRDRTREGGPGLLMLGLR